MSALRRIDLFVVRTSDKTVDEVKEYALKRANDKTDADSNQDDDGNPKELFYYDVTDFKRDGQKYMVFGDKAVEKLTGGEDGKMEWAEDILNVHEIQDRITVVEKDGVGAVQATVIE